MSSITKLYESISDFMLADTHDAKVCCRAKLAFESRCNAGAYESMSYGEFQCLQEEVEQQQAIVDIQLTHVYAAAMLLKSEMDKLMEVRNNTERIDELTARLYITNSGCYLPSVTDNAQVISV